MVSKTSVLCVNQLRRIFTLKKPNRIMNYFTQQKNTKTKTLSKHKFKITKKKLECLHF